MVFITLIILEAEIVKEKAKPTPVKKGLIYYAHNHITTVHKQNIISCYIKSFICSKCCFMNVLEAEVIKEKLNQLLRRKVRITNILPPI